MSQKPCPFIPTFVGKNTHNEWHTLYGRQPHKQESPHSQLLHNPPFAVKVLCKIGSLFIAVLFLFGGLPLAFVLSPCSSAVPVVPLLRFSPSKRGSFFPFRLFSRFLRLFLCLAQWVLPNKRKPNTSHSKAITEHYKRHIQIVNKSEINRKQVMAEKAGFLLFVYHSRQNWNSIMQPHER